MLLKDELNMSIQWSGLIKYIVSGSRDITTAQRGKVRTLKKMTW